MLTVAIPKRNKLQNIIVLTPKDGDSGGDSHHIPVKIAKRASCQPPAESHTGRVAAGR